MTYTENRHRALDRPMPALFFRGMSAVFQIRDLIRPRRILLDDVPLCTGDVVVDFGCGPGAYVPTLAARVGQTGSVIAVDIHPLAIQRVETLARRRSLHHVTACLTDGVHLPDIADDSVNVALLCDVFHMLGDQTGVLRELHRALVPDGILVVNDPHMDQDALIEDVMRAGYFGSPQCGDHVTIFVPSPVADEHGASQ